MDAKTSILRENLKYNLYPDKGHSVKKVIFIVCISVVFFLGLIFFKNPDNVSCPNSASGNRDITEIVSDGISRIRCWGTNTFSNSNSRTDNSGTMKHDSSTYNSKKDAEGNSYSTDAINKLLKDAETYLFNTAGDLFKNIY
jgi:hypothetical protein